MKLAFSIQKQLRLSFCMTLKKCKKSSIPVYKILNCYLLNFVLSIMFYRDYLFVQTKFI